MRLLRPPIPIAVKLYVALRQLGGSEIFSDMSIVHARANRNLGEALDIALDLLATKFGCKVSNLDLDHDPALQNRTKVYRDGVHVEYDPPANDREHLFWRPRGTQFEKSHKIKTTVRGDHGQHSDAALARKNKRIAKNRDPNRRKVKIPNRKKPWPKRSFAPKKPRK